MTSKKTHTEDPTTEGGPSQNPQQPQPALPPQVPVMIQLDALAAYLRQQDPNRDWTETLADPGPIEEEKADQEPDERADENEKNDKATGTPVTGTMTQEEREEEDLNKTARKQGLMTDEEFQAVMGGVEGMEVDTDEMAEGLDLASQVEGEGEVSGVGKESGGVTQQPVGEVEEKEPRKGEQMGEEAVERQFEQEVHQPEDTVEEERREETEKKIEAQSEEPGTTAPEVLKPKAVKRKLVLKQEAKVGGKKPTRVSQRCLGKWTSGKAKADTAEEAVEVSSGSEKTTPTKPGEGPSQTSQEGSPIATRTVPPTSTGQETDRVAEGIIYIV
ncbi:smoothelin-like protein 1 [Salvia hispanica]|uniref:smoothelin-like protein 1 n=1 Tax=Salvia hispanica TaxID=49212 RepID=UPI00200972A7|nr:smoothelin-like protein 1 [Salvia hispanica]